MSRQQDTGGDAGTTLRLESRSGVVLLLLGVTITFAAFDWLMSSKTWLSVAGRFSHAHPRSADHAHVSGRVLERTEAVVL